eukprot:COSAG06_NODE_1514_length_9226_cov_155.558782_11_plen_38_part_00
MSSATSWAPHAVLLLYSISILLYCILLLLPRTIPYSY